MGVVKTSNSCVKIELWSKRKHGIVKQHVQLKQHDVVLFGVQDMLQKKHIDLQLRCLQQANNQHYMATL
jgi:hypothetical protein